jgi:branched-chain amino acid aminotransferase
VAPSAAVLSVDDPGVRFGEGLFETMRVEDGRVPFLGRHLARMAASAAALGLRVPREDDVALAVAAALAAAPWPDARVRVTVTPRPTLLVEVSPEDPLPPTPRRVSATVLPGAWLPGNRLAEHKSLSYAAHRWARRRAGAAGAQEALLADRAGRLGEASAGNVLVLDAHGRLLTAPPDGLLPGVTRGVVMAIARELGLDVRERAPERADWEPPGHEILLTNAVGGVMVVSALDGVARPEGAAAAEVLRRYRAARRRAAPRG